MSWSAILLAMVAGPVDVATVSTSSPSAYSSYTQAWHAAHDAERPMLVILNPADAQKGISTEELVGDEKLQPVLQDYVVAVIDTTTDHGKQVHELFGNAPLPRVVVIDKNQKKQIYRTSEKLSSERLAKVLDQHKSGEIAKPVLNLGPVNSGCPSCQRRMSFSY
ncbi:hypothetical protein [Planctomicrobium sp. SH664]|uniref:hypothetical protein n=1 Tax=Planctomicrobium sp. SH664 TaxID=3448125 RepID=UPI003F5B9081